MKRYVVVGSGSRALNMYIEPFVKESDKLGTLEGVYNRSIARAESARDRLGGTYRVYDDFDRMIKECRPDCAVISNIDSLHHEFIVKAMEAGLDVVCEKPLTIDENKCNEIISAQKKSGKNITIAFNYRFIPYSRKIKELVSSGSIGTPLQINFEGTHDLIHGSSYFRRWHGEKAKSGTLFVTKGAHFFDLVNWWINDDPETVHAFGDLKFFGPNRKNRGERCLTCSYTGECGFFWDINADQFSKELYLDHEKESKYIRDKCVFSDSIDIYDVMSAQVRYKKGAIMNFSILAYAPYEGWKVNIFGTKGAIEAEQFRTGYRAKDSEEVIRLIDMDNKVKEYQIPKGEVFDTRDKGIGNYTLIGHNGGDDVLRRMLFTGDIPDTYNQIAGLKEGVMSVIPGIAAVRSIEQKKVINIKELISGF